MSWLECHLRAVLHAIGALSPDHTPPSSREVVKLLIIRRRRWAVVRRYTAGEIRMVIQLGER
jgi:hypothetical protein